MSLKNLNLTFLNLQIFKSKWIIKMFIQNEKRCIDTSLGIFQALFFERS